jgi:hypothetical protein
MASAVSGCSFVPPSGVGMMSRGIVWRLANEVEGPPRGGKMIRCFRLKGMKFAFSPIWRCCIPQVFYDFIPLSFLHSRHVIVVVVLAFIVAVVVVVVVVDRFREEVDSVAGADCGRRLGRRLEEEQVADVGLARNNGNRS